MLLSLAARPTIIIDSREKPGFEYAFPGYPVIRQALKTGDYGLVGLPSVAVERKEFSDFIGVCTQSRERWERELERASNMKRLFVIIEAEFSAIAKHQYRSAANPER